MQYSQKLLEGIPGSLFKEGTKENIIPSFLLLADRA
jgi:hypothetical protein